MSDDPISMAELARRAGTSTGTVSRVLNGGRVAIRTRERVLRIMRENGYRPKYLANRRRRIAVLLPQGLGAMSGPYPAAVLDGLAQAADALGRHLLVTPEADLAEAYTGLRAEAAIVLGDGMDAEIREQAGGALPILRLHSWMERIPGVLHAGADNAACGRLAVRCLLAAGHRRLARIRHAGAHSGGIQFRRASDEEAARGAARVLDLPIDGPEGIAHALLRLLDQHPRPTGLILERPHYILPTLQAAWRHGLRIPEHCSVVARECPDAAWGLPPITTFGFDLAALGRRALHMLDAQLEAGPQASAADPYLEPAHLIQRDSIRPPPPT